MACERDERGVVMGTTVATESRLATSGDRGRVCQKRKLPSGEVNRAVGVSERERAAVGSRDLASKSATSTDVVEVSESAHPLACFRGRDVTGT